MEAAGIRPEFGSPPSSIPAVRMSISERQYSYRLRDIRDPSTGFQDDTHDETVYEPNISSFLPPLLDVTARNPKWWRAQCSFRGLLVTGSRKDMQNRIRRHGQEGMSDSVKEVYHQLRREYMESVTKFWNQATANQKAQTWPKRLLYESFVLGPPSAEETIVVEVRDWGNVMEALCRALKVHCEIKKMHNHSRGQRLVVAGLTKQAVRSRFLDLLRESNREAERAKRQREEEERQAQEDFKRRFKVAQSQGKNSKGEWIVSGNWEIKCSYIEEHFGREDGAECSLDIRVTLPRANGQLQMYSTFDFSVITGVMRFVPLRASGSRQSSKGVAAVRGKEVEDEEREESVTTSDEESDGEESEEDAEDETTIAEFSISDNSLPSSTTRKFGFRWRGEETGEGEIQLGSDEKLCTLEFLSSNALTGIFISGVTGKIPFQGIRNGANKLAEHIARRNKKNPVYATDPSEEWISRSEAAYESARIGRWH
ncbi:hypothetical protein LTR67_007232 [Exophiala xenobiotica]